MPGAPWESAQTPHGRARVSRQAVMAGDGAGRSKWGVGRGGLTGSDEGQGLSGLRGRCPQWVAFCTGNAGLVAV